MAGELVAGIDFGTDTLRVAVYDAVTGQTRLETSRSYRRWADGLYCDAREQRFRQHPLDHIECLESCFDDVAEQLGSGSIAALAVASTGSTVAPVDSTGAPLALLDEFKDEPDAMFWMWKDHTSSAEAAQVDGALSAGPIDYTRYQGTYSSEWWWAKILRAVTTNPSIRQHAASWIEHADWVSNMLAGVDDTSRIVRNACAAGHKVLYNERLGGLVPAQVLGALDPYLGTLSDAYQTPPAPAGTPVGVLSAEWAERLQLSTDTVVGVGALDAHAGAVGAGVGTGTLVKVLGTSSVDIFVTRYAEIDGSDMRGVCGIAENSVIPGLLGGEASQAAFGDLFGWYANLLSWSTENVLFPEIAARIGKTAARDVLDQARGSLLHSLDAQAATRDPSGVLALDWVNGRRYPHGDDAARAAIVNLGIGDDAVDVYGALMEAAILGSKAIYASLVARGVRFQRLILIGGVADKSPSICQGMADALDLDVMVSRQSNICAKGAAIYAAVAAGCFADVPAAQANWCPPFAATHRPDPRFVEIYERRFVAYQALGREREHVRSRS